MRDFFVKTVVPIIVALIGSGLAFSVKFDTERGAYRKQFEIAANSHQEELQSLRGNHQQELGELARHLTITFGNVGKCP